MSTGMRRMAVLTAHVLPRSELEDDSDGPLSASSTSALSTAIPLLAAGVGMWYQQRQANAKQGASRDLSKADLQAEDLGFDSDRLHHAKEWAAKLQSTGKLPGLILAVARGGKLVFHEAYGEGCAKDSIVAVPSMPVVAATYLTLVDAGLAGIHDDVARYIPSFSRFRVHRSGRSVAAMQTDPLDTPITVFHLLTHTWGFPGATPSRSSKPDMRFLDGLGQAAVPSVGNDDDFEKLAQVPLVSQPGSCYRVGCAASVVAQIICKLTGKSLQEVVRERILSPLGMQDTDWSVPSEKLSRVANSWLAAPYLTHRLWGNYFTGEHSGHTSWLGWVARPAAQRSPESPGSAEQLYSTALDQLQFHTMLLRDGLAESGVRVLSQQSVQLMTTNASGHSLSDATFNTHAADASNSPGAQFPFLGASAGQGQALGMHVVLRPSASRLAGSKGTFLSWDMQGAQIWSDPALDITVFVGSQISPCWALPELQQEVAGLVYGALVPGPATKHVVKGEEEAGGWAGMVMNLMFMLPMLSSGAGLMGGMPAAPTAAAQTDAGAAASGVAA